MLFCDATIVVVNGVHCTRLSFQKKIFFCFLSCFHSYVAIAVLRHCLILLRILLLFIPLRLLFVFPIKRIVVVVALCGFVGILLFLQHFRFGNDAAHVLGFATLFQERMLAHRLRIRTIDVLLETLREERMELWTRSGQERWE